MQIFPTRRRVLTILAALVVLGAVAWALRPRVELLLELRELSKRKQVALVPQEVVLPPWSGATRTIEMKHWRVEVPEDVVWYDISEDEQGSGNDDPDAKAPCKRTIWWPDRHGGDMQHAVEAIRETRVLLMLQVKPLSVFETLGEAFAAHPSDVSVFAPLRKLVALKVRLTIKNGVLLPYKSELRRAKDGDLGVFWYGDFAREAEDGYGYQTVFPVWGELVLPTVTLISNCPKLFTGDEVRLIASTLRRR